MKNPMKELSISMEIRFKMPDESLTLSRLITGISNNLPNIVKALLATMMKVLEAKTTEQYMAKAPRHYVSDRHKSHQRSSRIYFGKFTYHFA